MFQSAPRSRERGDCGPSNRLNRKAFLPAFREAGHPLMFLSHFVVKERSKFINWPKESRPRELTGSRPALRVRATRLTVLDFRSPIPDFSFGSMLN
jgi:hypothetical protein